jgi:hypothetical protein
MTEAAVTSTIPLDHELGAGVFDFNKTLESFQVLRNEPNKPVNKIGWDYNRITRDAQSVRYFLNKSLAASSLFCVTLTFERHLSVQKKLDIDNI